eukprot:3513628-Heterocapsa_arctica.AAC.1
MASPRSSRLTLATRTTTVGRDWLVPSSALGTCLKTTGPTRTSASTYEGTTRSLMQSLMVIVPGR